jgi:hypothetical protein
MPKGARSSAESAPQLASGHRVPVAARRELLLVLLAGLIWLTGSTSARAETIPCPVPQPEPCRTIEPEPYPSVPPHSLREWVNTEPSYFEVEFLGDCAHVPARPARVTFSGHGRHRTLTITNPCVGEWHHSGGRPLPGLGLVLHPGNGHFAAGIVFFPSGGPIGRHRYTLTVTYAGQRLKDKITITITAGGGPGHRGYAMTVTGPRVARLT